MKLRLIWVSLFILSVPDLLLAQDQEADIPLPSGSVVVTHASRFYHSSEATASFTTALLRTAERANWQIFVLGQHDVETDPDWYAPRCGPTLTALSSRAGEHQLVPVESNEPFHVTVMGGYHCACLGRTMAYIVARFLSDRVSYELNIHLPMAGIYTGYVFNERGHLEPQTPAAEAHADSSIDGLDLATVTREMSDETWRPFMRDSLRFAVFKTYPMATTELQGVLFHLYRDNRLLDSFWWGSPPASGKPTRVVHFRYQ